MSLANVILIQVLLVILINIHMSNDAQIPPTVTVEHWTRTPYRTNVYSEIWTYRNNQDYWTPLDYIFKPLPQALRNANRMAIDLVILAAHVNAFTNKLHHTWVHMPWGGQIIPMYFIFLITMKLCPQLGQIIVGISGIRSTHTVCLHQCLYFHFVWNCTAHLVYPVSCPRLQYMLIVTTWCVLVDS